MQIPHNFNKYVMVKKKLALTLMLSNPSSETAT